MRPRPPGREALRAALPVLAAALAADCGRVTWTTSPFTPQSIEIAYSPVEDLSRLRFRVRDASEVTLEMADAAGRFAPIDFSSAPFPSGPFGCDGGTCYQLVMRHRIQLPPGGALLRATHSTFGTFVGPAAAFTPPYNVPVVLHATPADDNKTADVSVDDWLTAPGLERALRLGMWSEPTEDCTQRPERRDESAGVEVRPGHQQVPLPAALSDDGRYCVSARPEPRDGAPSRPFAVELLLFPEVERHLLDYHPPTEVTPIVWRLVPDLEIVDQERCASIVRQLHDTLSSSIASAVTKGNGTAAEMPLVDLSPDCHHSDLRALDAGQVADEVKQYLAQHYTNRYQAPLLFYIDNLDAPLPVPLVNSLELYQASFSVATVVPALIGIATGAGLSSFPWDLGEQYAAIDDPQFLPGIAHVVESTLPLQSQLHDDSQVLPLLPGELLARAGGWRWKVCQASPSIARLQGRNLVGDVIAPVVDPAAPPGFLVSLPRKVLVPRHEFVADEVVIRYELCRRYCSHPFHDEPGGVHDDWSRAVECVRNEVP